MPIGDNAPARKWADARLGGLADYPGAWTELLSEARRMPELDPVMMVNQRVNWHVRYREDGPADEWATAPVTLMRGYGDCEDFALAKMALLAELGVSPDEMFLVLLRDKVLAAVTLTEGKRIVKRLDVDTDRCNLL